LKASRYSVYDGPPNENTYLAVGVFIRNAKGESQLLDIIV